MQHWLLHPDKYVGPTREAQKRRTPRRLEKRVGVAWLIAINIILTMIIITRLQKRNVKINYFLLRMLYPKYVHQYKNLIVQETGQIPSIFYGWLISINVAAVCAVAGLLAHAGII